ncbi:hypothetical protein W97_07555 [Coniosporium apollinis CBS 100218]|uniref:Major facilitator superfamily (MFS) profile domain-containing protein n=1 Tax=Coniosporium apollinis (strain CBS 100218) TaxID=1168221 RepID=R7Z2A1_CONA1|nr:uncharacterized protein W97_07555 [Coniosporium apollinis CBS 100218]EON68297.1 hypothetical protein W97_07555 [Coniosporium apollinis CBS 100218]
MAISQLCGFNTLMYDSSALFAMVGFNKPVAVSIVVGATNFLFTVFNMLVIDKFGRRIVLLITNTVTCWGRNIIIAPTFLSKMKAMTPSGAFSFYAGICFFGWVFVIFYYPEVKGLPLETARQIYSHGFGVKYAAQLQKERKANPMRRGSMVA